MAILAIGGYPYAGKTVLSNKLATLLNYKQHHTEPVFKKLAEEEKISEVELNQRIASQPAYEIRIDAVQAKIMQTEDNYVIQGSMAPFQIANPAFKKINILLEVSYEEGARRQLSRSQNQDKTLEQMVQETIDRVEEERSHYKTLYRYPDHLDPKYFHIVVDTTSMTEDQVFQEVVRQLTPLLGLEEHQSAS